MLGMGDTSVGLAYLLSICASVLCVIYGATHWNKGNEAPDEETRHWAEEEDKLEDEL
jgi:hypothetical protein